MFWMQLRRGQLDAFDRRTPVIVPTAAVEQHGEHLPLGTDCMIVGAILKRLAKAMPGRVLILPTVQVACSEHHMGFPGSLTITHETYRRTVMEHIDSGRRHGFTRFMILNSHGGNVAINSVLSEQIGQRHPEIECLVGSWWSIARKQIEPISEGPFLSCGHACEFETSILQEIAPELVDMDQAEDGGNPHHVDSMNFDFFRGGNAAFYRPFHVLSDNGVYGRPSLASPEKGRRILEGVVTGVQTLIESFWKDVREPAP